MDNTIIFTTDQQKIIDLKEGVHLVLAPPGSGKTELLATRVEKAIKEEYLEDEIICLTFTNRAAKGMKDRIENKNPQTSIFIGNIHNYCTKFLIKNKLIPTSASILDEEDVDNLIKEIKNEIGYNENVYNPNILRYNTYIKQKKLNFDEKVLFEPDYDNLPKIHKIDIICKKYEQIKSKFNFIDFDDILTLSYNYLLKHKVDYLYANFKWVQVDEVQDLNPIQWGIVELISNESDLKVLFGDYEQAIFSFMGAKLKSLHEFEEVCKQSKKNGIHNLLKNFRSPSYLLNIYIDYAKALLSPNWKKDPIPNKTISANSGDLRIKRVQGSIYNEAEIIVNNLLPKLVENNNDSTAIIVRYNATADIIDNLLKETSYKYFKVSGFDLFRRKSIKGLLSFFTIFNNEFDRIAWIRLFYEYNITKTLKESREIIDFLFKSSITPIDFIKYNNKSTELIEFQDAFNNSRVIVFDTETTGLNTNEDDIIQIAAIELINGKVISEFEIYMNTDKDLTDSEKVHHISKEFLDENGVSSRIGLNKFIEFIKKDNTTLVAHNLSYDYEVLKSNLNKYLDYDISLIDVKYFDTLKITKLVYRDFSSYKLKDLLNQLNVDGVNSHNALDDVKATSNLIIKMAPFISEKILAIEELLKNEKLLKLIYKFNERITPLYDSVFSMLYEDLTIQSIINEYFNYAIKINMLQEENFNNNENIEIQKLIKHLDFHTKDDNLNTLKNRLIKYIPDYLTFKESDLYFGDEQIVLSTVFKAKGLEFDNVIIAETTDSTYPSWASKTEEEITEDARALYVALSRAKKKIFITSHSIFVSKYGRSFPRKESPFINSIRHHFEYENY